MFGKKTDFPRISFVSREHSEEPFLAQVSVSRKRADMLETDTSSTLSCATVARFVFGASMLFAAICYTIFLFALSIDSCGIFLGYACEPQQTTPDTLSAASALEVSGDAGSGVISQEGTRSATYW